MTSIGLRSFSPLISCLDSRPTFIYTAKDSLKLPRTGGREAKHPPLLAPQPGAARHQIEQRSAQCAAEMRPPFAPVEAETADRAPPPRQLIEVHAEPGEKGLPRARDDDVLLALHQRLAAERLEQGNAALAGQMVVADTGLAQRRVARSGADPDRAGALRQAHQRLERFGDVGAGQAEIAMAALLADREQPRFHQA